MPGRERVTHTSLADHLTPISSPQLMSSLPKDIWSDEQWARILDGFQAQGTDDRWNVFAVGHVVFFHRSRTGRGIFEATFAPRKPGQWRVVAALVETDPDHYRSDDDKSSRLLAELINIVLLGEAPH